MDEIKDMLETVSLEETDKIILIIAAIIVILLVLVIMYKIDNMPEGIKIKKKHDFEGDNPEEDEDLENQIENTEIPAEEKMEELFNNEPKENVTPGFEMLDFGNNSPSTAEEPAKEEVAENAVEEKEEPVAEANTQEQPINIFNDTPDTGNTVPEENNEPMLEQNQTNDDIDIYAGTGVEQEEPQMQETEVKAEPAEEPKIDIFAGQVAENPVEEVKEVQENNNQAENPKPEEQPKSENSEWSMFTDDN